MKRVCVIATVLLGILLSPVLATAQERGQVGITMGYPSAIGIQWQASERLALRPEISFSFFSRDVELDADIPFIDDEDLERSGSSFTTGVAAIWYLRAPDSGVRPYVSPRVTYGRAGESEGPDSTAWGFSGSFGAQYTPSRRFAIYGEAGFGFSSSENTTESTFADITTTSTSWGTRTAVGVIFYFGN